MNTTEPDDYAGMAWWNNLERNDRAWWLGRANSTRPVDAWRAYKREARPAEQSSPSLHNALEPFMSETFEAYETRVIDWAKQRQIISNSSAIAQVDKAFEELAELRQALADNDTAGIIDGFGDTEVCLINARALAGVTIAQCLDHAWNEIKDRTGHLGADGIFYKDA